MARGAQARRPVLPTNDVQVHYGQGKQAAIHAVEPAAVAGQQRSAIFHAGAALQGRFAEIAELSGDVGHRSERQGFDGRDSGNRPVEEEEAEDQRSCERGGGAFPRLAGADDGGELVAAECAAHVVGADVSDPVEHQRVKEPIAAAGGQ